MKTGSSLELSHDPDVVGRDSSYATQVVDIQCIGVGTGYDAPVGAIPVLDECVAEGLIGVAGRAFSIAHSPDIVGGDGFYRIQSVVGCPGTGIGTGNNTPVGTIPMLNKRIQANGTCVLEGTHSPDIVGGDGIYPTQVIGG